MKAKKLSKIKNGSQFTIPCTSGLYVKNGKVKGMDWISVTDLCEQREYNITPHTLVYPI